ncbi:hypothetical protein KQR86_001980 [Acinetobacter baumannii]|nr:hypothetical protein [Acinetobacter baumannii]EKU9177991.1 hypothetical protein [Acinetobacter baumannii]EKU9312963.1 hypothetical protein [Acinetobacter baumannii]EKX2154185.1 hypothetical protein [Acinetobacter baumannii]EKX4309677.1 hypothetical protein [Acinetobacter baumannii]
MLILDQFKQADLSEKIAAFTSTVILIGISYKLGYYFTRLLDSLWIIQFFNVFDLAYSSLRLLILYFLILVLHDKVFVMGSNERNVLKFALGLMAICIYYIYEIITVKVAFSFFFAVALFIGIIFAFTFNNSRPLVKYVAITVLIIIVPFLQGLSDIQKNIYRADLPKVLIKDSKPNEDWRFLDKANDKLILLNQKNTKEIKIVGMDEVKKFTNSGSD